MPLSVFVLVLAAAALHATWNVVVKQSADKLRMSALVATMAGVVAAVTLPFVAAPAPASWPFMIGSVCLQVVYWVMIANAYRLADMSQAYPLMRGAAPLLVAMVSITMFAEPLSPIAWTGVGLVSFGISAMTVSAWRGGSAKGVAVALATAFVIAGYTIVDGLGVRRSGAPVAYTMWIFLLTAPALLIWEVSRDGAAFARYALRHVGLGLIGGIGTIASYGIALWAMTLAPVAIVAALRETSILFATAIAALVLKEPVDRYRLAAIAIIAAGAGVLRLA